MAMQVFESLVRSLQFERQFGLDSIRMEWAYITSNYGYKDGNTAPFTFDAICITVNFNT